MFYVYCVLSDRSAPTLSELILAGEKEQLEDLLCQEYPEKHMPYTSQEAQNALHLLAGQQCCDTEILQWLTDARVSLNKPCIKENTSVLHKVTVTQNVEAVEVCHKNEGKVSIVIIWGAT